MFTDNMFIFQISLKVVNAEVQISNVTAPDHLINLVQLMYFQALNMFMSQYIIKLSN